MINLVVAYKINQNDKNNYDLWYLEFTSNLKLVGIKKTNKMKLISRLFSQENNDSESWYSWDQRVEKPKKIEITDFIAKGIYDETHLGDLPSIENYQKLLDSLRLKIDLKNFINNTSKQIVEL